MPALSSSVRIRLGAEMRHQTSLLLRDPGPMIGYVVMAMLLISVTRPMYNALGRFDPSLPVSGIDEASAGMAVMFSLFALKVVGAHMLNERTWNTWERLRATPASFGEIILAKSLPLFGAVLIQQVILFGFSAILFGLHPKSGWWLLFLCGMCWSACVMLLGAASSTLARSPAQLSAGGDMFAMLTTVMGGALVPVVLLPQWLRDVAPASPGYWALAAYRTSLLGSPGSLLRPIAMLGVFGLFGVVVAALIGRSQK